MRYSCLLVDDEEDVITAIKKKLDWDSLGYMPPRCAHNGLEALDMAEELVPDVVMTDIKMSYMDGLELSRRIKELYPNVRIIIFSGFDEFEYAREAIRLEAEEYILKPINAEELSKVFLRIREQLDRERDEQQNIRRLQEYYIRSLPALRENFYASLMEGKFSETEIARQMEDYRIALPGPRYAIAVFHISGTELPEGMSPVLAAVSVRRLAEERMRERWNGQFFSYLGNTVMIVQLDEETEMLPFTDECDKFCRLAKSALRATVTVGVGKCCGRLRDIPMSYGGARSAVSYRMIYGTAKAINIAEIAPQERNTTERENDEAMRHIFRLIRMDHAEELSGAIAEHIDRNTSAGTSLQEYRFFVMGVAGELYRFARDNELPPEEIFGDNDGMYRTMQQLEPKEFEGWMISVCSRMQSLIREKRASTTRSFADRAVDYVRDHYADADLTVDGVCGYLGVSAAYFSTVFKRETGKTFINYLTDYRMERALELLMEGNEKTYVIAREVGYSDPNYFSYVFKKQFGMSPSKYKSAKGGGAS